MCLSYRETDCWDRVGCCDTPCPLLDPNINVKAREEVICLVRSDRVILTSFSRVISNTLLERATDPDRARTGRARAGAGWAPA